jgi:H+/Cl- antiporter ClcA
MAPLILVSTVLTHLFGGSAGREGTVVQMGASLADQLTRRETSARRTALLQAGAGAGFGAALGTPLAGMIFGLEVIARRSNAWLECFLAAIAAFATTLLLRAPHTHYPPVNVPAPDFKLLAIAAGAGVLFGLTARAFVLLTHAIEKLQKRFVKYPPLRPVVGGVLLVAFFTLTSSLRYAGLGLPVIQQSLSETASWWDPLLKAFYTALTIGSGFKGGEFIPLVFIGTTLGSALGFSWLAAVGFSSVFGAAANTPLACAVMAMEIFGWTIAPYALLAGFIAFLVSGHPGIYKTQPRVPPRSLLGWTVKLR